MSFTPNNLANDARVPQQTEEFHTYIPNKSKDKRWLFDAPPPVQCCDVGGDGVTPCFMQPPCKAGASVQLQEPKVREYPDTLNGSPVDVAMGREVGAIAGPRQWGGRHHLGLEHVAAASLICLIVAAIWCWAAPSVARHSALGADCMFVSMGSGSTCKRGSADTSLDGGGTATVLTLGPQTQCEQRCLARTDCFGYEYRSNEWRCELWHVHVGATKLAHHPSQFECKKKLCKRRAAGNP